MAITFPYGYNGSPAGMGTMLTWDQMMTKKSVYNLHPEVQRRFYALIHFAAACNVHLGVGTGWRVQPDPPPAGFAKPGNSWHESCPVSPNSATAMAIDTVPNVSWPWMEQNCNLYGFRTFKYVGNEPWHIQPVEISTSRKYATVCPTLPTWPIPTEPPAGTVPPVTPPTTPVGTFTLQLQKNELTPDKREALRGNGDVFIIQQIAQGHYRQLGAAVYDCGKPDGDYGPRTQDAVMQMQRDGGLLADACCGPKTWSYILNSTGA